ncbi:MAG: uL15 family ribosomal protein [Nitrososphaeria archaeon]
MATRKRKIRRLRGSRTVGWGQVGQHRKSGMKGGVGKAGLHKHKWSWTVVYAPDYFGKNGFYSLSRVRKSKKWVNVGELELLYENQKEKKEINGMPLLDLTSMGYDKLLGKGKVSRAYSVVVSRFTAKAKESIEAAGGKISEASIEK